MPVPSSPAPKCTVPPQGPLLPSARTQSPAFPLTSCSTPLANFTAPLPEARFSTFPLVPANNATSPSIAAAGPLTSPLPVPHGDQTCFGFRAGDLGYITDAKEVPRTAWAATPVADVMTRSPLKTVTPATPLEDALRLLVDGTLNQLPVVEDDRAFGLLGRADVLRFLQLRTALGRTIAPR